MAKSEREFVSVIIPTHRRAGLFGECLKSLSRQDYGQNNFEVIAVHDGMDCDYDERSLHRIAPKHFRFAKITRSGVAGARNCAISRAKGSLVMMLDDDCVAQKSWIRSYVSYMNKNNQVVASGGSVRSRKPKTIIQRYVALKRLLGRPIVDDDGRIASIIGANGCYRKAVLDNVDGFREDLSYSGGEDLDLSFRCRKIGPLG